MQLASTSAAALDKTPEDFQVARHAEPGEEATEKVIEQDTEKLEASQLEAAQGAAQLAAEKQKVECPEAEHKEEVEEAQGAAKPNASRLEAVQQEAVQPEAESSQPEQQVASTPEKPKGQLNVDEEIHGEEEKPKARKQSLRSRLAVISADPLQAKAKAAEQLQQIDSELSDAKVKEAHMQVSVEEAHALVKKLAEEVAEAQKIEAEALNCMPEIRKRKLEAAKATELRQAELIELQDTLALVDLLKGSRKRKVDEKMGELKRVVEESKKAMDEMKQREKEALAEMRKIAQEHKQTFSMGSFGRRSRASRQAKASAKEQEAEATAPNTSSTAAAPRTTTMVAVKTEKNAMSAFGQRTIIEEVVTIEDSQDSQQ